MHVVCMHRRGVVLFVGRGCVVAGIGFYELEMVWDEGLIYRDDKVGMDGGRNYEFLKNLD